MAPLCIRIGTKKSCHSLWDSGMGRTGISSGDWKGWEEDSFHHSSIVVLRLFLEYSIVLIVSIWSINHKILFEFCMFSNSSNSIYNFELKTSDFFPIMNNPSHILIPNLDFDYNIIPIGIIFAKFHSSN